MGLILVAMVLATPNFPSVIQQQLGLAQPPRCTICHATDAGGAGTVVKPFGIYLRSRGLVAFDEASLRNALLADIGERHSSSGGVTDIDALKAGEDPNGTQGSNLVPTYGCSSGGSAVGLLTLVALGTWLWLHRRAVESRRRRASEYAPMWKQSS
jgi:hypothetical protein